MRVRRLQAFCVAIGFLTLGGKALAQSPDAPPIGTIDYYGLRTIAVEDAMRVMPFAVGESLPSDSPEPLATAMAEALGVPRVEFNFVCCSDSGLLQIYVGVEEMPGATAKYYSAPTGDIELPHEIVATFEEFLARMMESVMNDAAREDRSQGHALAEAPAVRGVQESFLVYAAQNENLLREVLRESSNAQHRAIAAHVLGYVEDKAGIAEALAHAVQDPSGEVRNYATRALAVMAEYAAANPAAGIAIPADSFIDMLNSFVWSDRNKGLAVLAALTSARDPLLLDALRARTLPALIEMCRWRHWGHAAPACLILQRIIGMPDAFDEQSRDETLMRAAALFAP
jgi:hypothetical protein